MLCIIHRARDRYLLLTYMSSVINCVNMSTDLSDAYQRLVLVFGQESDVASGLRASDASRHKHNAPQTECDRQ